MSEIEIIDVDPVTIIAEGDDEEVIASGDVGSSDAAEDVITTRKSLYAAPFDAMMFNGMQVNGSGDVNQYTGYAPTLPNSSTAVQFADSWSASKVNSVGVVTATVGAGSGLPGSGNYLVLVAPSSLSGMVSGDHARLRTVIEGYRAARLQWGTAVAYPLSYCANIFSDNPGTVLLKIANDTNTRFYYKEHVLTTALGWTFVTGTIPGDVTGTWSKLGAAGIKFNFFGAGKEATPVAPNVWTTLDKVQSTGSSENLLNTTNARLVVADFLVFGGLEVPTQDRLPYITRSWDEEMRLCQRYLFKTYAYANFWGAGSDAGYLSMENHGGGQMFGSMTFPVRMVRAPAVSLFSYIGTPNTWSNISGTNMAGAGSVNSGSEWGVSAGTIAVPPAAGSYIGHIVAAATL